MKKLCLILLALVILLSLVACGGGSSSDKPWKKLGVSEREYWEVYNYHKNHGK